MLLHCNTKCIYKEMQWEWGRRNTASFVSNLSYQSLGRSFTIAHTLTHIQPRGQMCNGPQMCSQPLALRRGYPDDCLVQLPNLHRNTTKEIMQRQGADENIIHILNVFFREFSRQWNWTCFWWSQHTVHDAMSWHEAGYNPGGTSACMLEQTFIWRVVL